MAETRDEDAIMMHARRGAIAVLSCALLLVAGAGLDSAADPRSGPDQVREGAREMGRGVEETTKGIGKTVTEGAKEVESRAKEAGREAEPAFDRLHDRAKGFGEAIWDAMRAAGRSVRTFFTGSRG
jgi:hypothetical protein